MNINTSKYRLLIFCLILVIAGWVIYTDALYSLFIAIFHREDSSHGLLVPIISCYILWLKLSKIKKIEFQAAVLPGCMMLAGGLILLLLSGRLTSFSLFLSILSFLFIAGALILILFGRQVFHETAFPLFFLATMIPWPAGFYYQTSELMRYINTWGSVSLSRSLGVSMYREGYDIYIPGAHLVVDSSCSGIRYLLSFFTFSIAYAALFKQGSITRILVIASSIPISIIAGIARLSVVFLAAYYISPFWAQHKPHIFLSWVVFAVFLFVAIWVAQVLFKEKASCR